MSQRPIARSPDLDRLRSEGYDISVVAGHLVVRDVPYVNDKRGLSRGVLITPLTLSGDTTTTPGTHVASWVGSTPCTSGGVPINGLLGGSPVSRLSEELAPTMSFSNKPPNGYANYYDLVTRYAQILGDQARAIDARVTACMFPPVPAPDDTVFQYVDSASSRAGIVAAANKLRGQRVAIVGVGGTGAYVVDFVAKTPVDEIHLFDGDDFLTHNAFRSPGAASLETLATRPRKARYLRVTYSNMHRKIVAHEVPVDEGNVGELQRMTFVFLCLTSGRCKQAIVARLEEWGIPFIDVGMGIQVVDDALMGLIRVTTSTKGCRTAKSRIAFGDGEANNEYDRNIQIAELNALNAALAVIKWKKLLGVYLDQEKEHNSLYVIGGGTIINEEYDGASPTTDL